MYDTTAETGPQVPGGRYLCAYWAHEYVIDAMFTAVHHVTDASGASRWIPGATWYDVTWIPAEDAVSVRASEQWRGSGYQRGRHCTSWDHQRDQIVSQPS
jgi:hypothetical protein